MILDRYFTTITIAPTLFLASIYLTFCRIILVYTDHLSRLRPRSYALYFITSDIISLILQSVGGGLASAAHDYDEKEGYLHIMVAGLVLQVVSLLIFIGLALEFVHEVYKSPGALTTEFEGLRKSKRFKSFFCGK